MSKISLITTFIDRAAYLPDCIESTLGQTFEDWELILFDDGSTDKSLDICLEYARQDFRIKVIQSEHVGRAPALVEAYKHCTGKYIGWLDSDDFLAPTCLEDTVGLLDRLSQDVGVVYTDYIVTNEDGSFKEYGKVTQTPYSREKILVQFMTYQFRLIRREAYEAAGGVDPTCLCCMDVDFCIRLSEVTGFYHLQKPLYFCRHHKDCITFQKRFQQIEFTARSVRQALKRRGMNNIELEVQTFTRFTLIDKLAKPSAPKSSAWALDEDTLQWILDFIQENEIKTVVELGTGESTLMFAEAQKKGVIEDFRSLEHDSVWYESIISRLSEKGFSSESVLFCPLRLINSIPWYDISKASLPTIDLLLVDGPPGDLHLTSRYPVLSQLKPFLSANTFILIDDFYRYGEQQAVGHWLKEYPTLKLVDLIKTQTGLAVLQFQPD
ncbi:glycosyltransferase (plasmid) [Kovacikia minuta CCNUW1]|uniref:glycosyltransferase n=1 Tax=Kovacikia minuta TaxID=2931930 RepID=UPI001CCA687D|nr:glycosyltransferase [Kovacikia minuta]UBF29905.1 glycosyltransferase [Kovacikia minuta CCNUW1]